MKQIVLQFNLSFSFTLKLLESQPFKRMKNEKQDKFSQKKEGLCDYIIHLTS